MRLPARPFFPHWTQQRIIHNPLFVDKLPIPYIGEREKVIVNVGRLHNQKNQEILIKAFHKIANKYPDYKLVIYGEGSERSKLNNIIEKLELKERVSMPGVFDDVLDKIKTASMFVLSSNFEGMPNALIEAMALGLPVIATDCPSGGPRELIKDGINGLLVPVGDINALANKMDFMLTAKEKAEFMANKATMIRKRLDAQKIGKQWLDFSLEIITKKKMATTYAAVE